MPANTDLQRRLGSIEALLHQVEATADPSLRASVQELVELVMSLHGAALDRMLELMRAAGDSGDSVIHKLAGDDLVSSLLVLHGLHPRTMEARVTLAVDKLRPRLHRHEADVELLGVEDGAVHLRLEVKAQGCGSNAESLREMLEEAVYAAAPDLATLTIEGAEAKNDKAGFVPLAMLLNGHAVPAGKGGL